MLNYRSLGLAAFSRYYENYMKQVTKALGGLTVGVVWRQQVLQIENALRSLDWAKEVNRSIEQITRSLNPSTVKLTEIWRQQSFLLERILWPLEKAIKLADLTAPWKNLYFIPDLLTRGNRDYLELPSKLRLLPFILVWRALNEGDTETVDHFLGEWCGMANLPKEDKEEAYKALWTVLRREKWRYLADPKEYIKTAVWRTVKLRRSQREIEFSGGATDLLFRDFQKRGLELVSLDDLPEGEGRLWVPAKDDTQSVEDRLFIEWVLRYVRDPSDRKAILAYCRGYAETLRETFGGDKNRQDAARRRLRKLAERLRPLLFT